MHQTANSTANEVNAKKILKVIGLVVGIPLALIVLLTIALYLPPVQNWAVRQVASYASKTTGMNISVGHVSLLFPLDLGVERALVVDRGDTVAHIGEARVDVKLLPLLHSKVDIESLSMKDVKLNTKSFISNTQIKGQLKSIFIAGGTEVNWRESLADVSSLNLNDGAITVWLADTAKQDTTPSTNRWVVKARELRLRNTAFTLHMPGDTMSVALQMPALKAKTLTLDLGKGAYSVSRLLWQQGALAYDNNFEARARGGIDFNHMKMTALNLGAQGFSYKDGTINVSVDSLRFHEQSGLDLRRFHGPFYMDSTSLKLASIDVKTSVSTIRGKLAMDLNAFDDKNPGKLKADIHATLGKPDLLLFMADASPLLRKSWPAYPLDLHGKAEGNLQRLSLKDVKLSMPMVFSLDADGTLANIMNEKLLRADLNVKGRTLNTGFANTLLRAQLGPDIQIPSGIGLTAKVKARGQSYAADFSLTQGGGSVKGKAEVNTAVMNYRANIDAQSFPLRNILTSQPIQPLTGSIELTGSGTDIFSPRTKMNLKADLNKFKYDTYDLNNTLLTASVANGKAHATLESHNDLLGGTITIDALTLRRRLRATIAAELSRADLMGLGLTQKAVTAALCGHIDVASDLKESHRAWGMLSEMTFNEEGKTYRPADMVLDVLAERDTTNAVISNGDFQLNASLSEGYKNILSHSTKLATELQRQWKARIIDESALRKMIPTGHIYLKSGTGNIFAGIMRLHNVALRHADADLEMSPLEGINGKVALDSLVAGGVQLDTIRVNFNSTDDGIAYTGQIANGKNNPQYTFRALIDGGIKGQEMALNTKLYDKNQRLGVSFGLAAQMEQEGIRARLSDLSPVFGYKKFNVNSDNSVFLANNRRVSAKVDLIADDGTGVKVYTDDTNVDALQDLTVSLNKFDLEKVLSVIPYTPAITGTMNGDFHLIQTAENTTVSSTISVDKMTYERCPMGNVQADLVYMPTSEGGHSVSGLLYSEGKEVAILDGTLAKDQQINALLQLEKFPLSMANGFVPEQLLGLRGYGEGSLQVKGSTAKPDITGEVFLDSASLFSAPYGVEMRFANDPVRIENSRLLFENFEMFANNDQPLNVAGTFDFSDLNRMMLDVKMRAQNFEVIDAKENPRSEAYGKAFVNFYGVMQGPVDALRLRGKVDLLGNTDMVYVMRDSELSTDNQLQELVKFTNLEDTTTESVSRPFITGMDMSLMISVDESAHILCMLNADHSNYIDLMGGGDLRMNYTASDGLSLTGRYTLNNGEMKYALPVIPLKTFNIQNGSYVEFTGDPMDPTLNITATESVKATVNEGSSGRAVNFNCGVKLSKTLSSPGIEFIIEAPNDMTVQDELNTMSEGGRGKVAVTMLASGMYLTDGNTSSFSMNSALSSFLQGEINNIAGRAMQSMGLDIGMSIDNAVTSEGAMHTDYNFKFSKRLWNNRLSVSVGGKVSTGAEVDEQRSNNFFDNVELQYRLDQNSSKYLRLFYNNSYYDWLEGTVGLYGVGFKWTRKLRHFKDIFRFGSESTTLPADTAKTDTTNTQKAKAQAKREVKN